MTHVTGRDFTYSAQCRGCGYALRDLPEQRCPECGRPFVASDPATMRVPGWKPPRVRRPPPSFGATMILLAACAALLTVGSAYNGNPLLSLYGFTLWLAVPVSAVVRGQALRESRRSGAPFTGAPAGPRWGRWAIALLLLTLVGGVSYERCPHARYFAWGAMPIAVVGDACGNARHLRPILLQLRPDS